MKSHNSKRYLLVTLGALAAFAPLATDLYLPGLPAVNSYFNCSVSMVQLTLMACMVGLAAGNLIVGPLSDKFGRIRPLRVSLVLFILSSAACTIAWNIEVFILFRFIQGFAGAGGIVMSRSISRDLFSGKDLAKFFSLIAAIIGLAPITAPLLGGLILSFAPWQSIFAFLTLIGVFLLILSLKLKETHHTERRTKSSAIATYGLYIPVLRNMNFSVYVLILGVSSAILFSYISASPFILQTHYGLSPVSYSFCFALNSIGMTIGCALAPRLKSLNYALKISSRGLIFVSAISFAVMTTQAGLFFFEASIFVMLFFVGMTNTSSTTLALQNEHNHAGTASAVIGAIMFVFGGIVSPLVGIGNIMHSTAFIIFSSSVIILLLTLLSMKLSVEYTKPAIN